MDSLLRAAGLAGVVGAFASTRETGDTVTTPALFDPSSVYRSLDVNWKKVKWLFTEIWALLKWREMNVRKIC